MASTSDPRQPSALATFPLELLQFIALHLPTLRDVLTFSTLSHRFYSAINADATVYRHLFLKLYDPPIPALSSFSFSPTAQSPTSNPDTFDYKSAFITRHLLLRSLRTCTQLPDSTHLQLLRTLLLEAPSPKSKNLNIVPYSLPVAILSGAASSFTPQPRLLLALQLLILPIRRLEEREVARVRRSAYAMGRMDGDWLNLTMLNSVGLLIGWHLDKHSGSGVFYQKDMLEEGELVGWWKGRLGDVVARQMRVQGTVGAGGGEKEDIDDEIEREHPAEGNDDGDNDLRDVPTRWFGAYTYKQYVFEPGIGDPELGETGDNFLSDLHLEFQNCRFKGSGKDYKSFTIQDGEIGKPVTVEGIPGWRKVRFTKNYVSHLWVYVGCMLPGKNVIIGRWGYPGNSTRTGIFMWWAVPTDTGDLGSRDNRLSIVP